MLVNMWKSWEKKLFIDLGIIQLPINERAAVPIQLTVVQMKEQLMA